MGFTIQPPPHHYQITLPYIYFPTFLKFYHYLSISLVPPYYLDLYHLNIITFYHYKIIPFYDLTSLPSCHPKTLPLYHHATINFYYLTTIPSYLFKTTPFFHPTSQHLPATSLFIVTLFIFIYLSNKTDPY